MSKPSLPPIAEYTRNSSQPKIVTGGYNTEQQNFDKDPYGVAQKNEEIRSRRMLREPEKALYGENSSILKSNHQVVGSRRILGSRRLTSGANQISPSRQFMTGPGNQIDKHDNHIAIHDQNAHLQEIISPSRAKMMPTTKEIRDMTESRRVALGLQSRAYGNPVSRSMAQLPDYPNDAVPKSRWEKAQTRNEPIDKQQGLK